MSIFFLQTNALANLTYSETALALVAGFFLFFLVLTIAIYIYASFAYMAIARKAKLNSPGLAWIPAIGPTIIAFQTSGMHWWPWLLYATILISWIPYVNFLFYLALILSGIYSIIWHWKMFQKVGKPGWWAILTLIPLVGLIFIGLAAWSKK